MSKGNHSQISKYPWIKKPIITLLLLRQVRKRTDPLIHTNMRLLHIFIKNPRLGYVKTRLAATVGNEEALRIYHILLEKTQEAALNSRCERWLWYSDEITTNDQWATPDFNKKVQSPGDLGQRMQAAFQCLN